MPNYKCLSIIDEVLEISWVFCWLGQLSSELIIDDFVCSLCCITGEQSLKWGTDDPYTKAMTHVPTANQHLVTSKVTRILSFVKHNLCKCSLETKCVAYTSIVRPLLEYGSLVWDPYLQKDINSIEMVQRCAACYTNMVFWWKNVPTKGLERESMSNLILWIKYSS